MGNAFALHVNATLVEVLSFFTAFDGSLWVNGWFEDSEGGDWLTSFRTEDLRVMA